MPDIAARFADVDARIQRLRASFRQTVRVEGSDTVQTVEGDVLFEKPDRLRLTHRVPEEQTVVSDGATLWVYRESTHQVIKTPLEQWRKNEPLARGLLGFGRSAELLSRYDATLSTVSAPDAQGYRTFELTLVPKKEDRKEGGADFTLKIKSDTRSYFPGESSLAVGRAVVRSSFSDVRLNPELPPDAFRFTPPKGADIFETPPTKP